MDSIISFLDLVFGINSDSISLLQMLARAFVVFIFGIFLVRIGKRRFVSKMTAFDFILAIMIGSLLSRSVTEEKYFLEIITVSTFLILLHNFISYISAQSDRSTELIKGKVRVFIEDGEINWRAIKKADLTEHDLIQALRLSTNTTDLSKVLECRMERNGDLSFILKS